MPSVKAGSQSGVEQVSSPAKIGLPPEAHSVALSIPPPSQSKVAILEFGLPSM